jgi:hypothetical protein
VLFWGSNVGGKNVVKMNDLKRIGSRPLSFASESDLYQYLDLPKGSVTPIGIILFF